MEPKPSAPRLSYTEIEERMWRDCDAGQLQPLIEYLRLGGAADQKRIAEEYLALPSASRAAPVATDAPPLLLVHHTIAIADPTRRQERLRRAEAVRQAMTPLRANAGIAPLFAVRETADGIELAFPAVPGRPLADGAIDVALGLTESAGASDAPAALATAVADDDDLGAEPPPPVAAGLESLAIVVDRLQRLLGLVDELHVCGVVHGGVGMDTIVVRPDGGLVLVDCGLGMLRAEASPVRQEDVAALGRLLCGFLDSVRPSARNWSWVARQLARWLMAIGRRAARDPVRMPTVEALTNAVEQACAESERAAAATGLRALLLRLRRAGPE